MKEVRKRYIRKLGENKDVQIDVEMTEEVSR